MSRATVSAAPDAVRTASRPRGVGFYRNAIYWFALLLVVLVAGFWRSYFSVLGQGSLHITHHVHGLAMLLWVLLLIVQAWFIRTGRKAGHRLLGRTSIVLAPIVVASGVWVNLQMMAGATEPLPAGLLGAYWWGYFLMLAFGVFYAMGIIHRRRLQLHARYMAATALVFLTPGLGRAWFNYLYPLTGWEPNALQVTSVPLLIGCWLLLDDWRHSRTVKPYLLFCTIWVLGVGLGRVGLPHLELWREFAAWSARIQG
ncbi:MAG TPA: hypothetical protein VK912_08845 [Longimicrobiales bacterium]|nr:hypothetical protein [Longimicrobiales bacterium]